MSRDGRPERREPDEAGGGPEAGEPLSEREAAERALLADTDWLAEADRVFDELMERTGEGLPEPRLHATRRAVELLGEVHRAAPVIHIAGTNGKSSTARITGALLQAAGLRTGVFTSPHVERLAERIEIDGEPVSDERLAANWDEIAPLLEIVDRELAEAGEPRLTFFEALTVLAFACFADAPVDVVVLEAGIGGEWDSTNVADGAVAVFTPVALDHMARLGGTIAEIARTKAGIVKPAARVVSAAQPPEALAELERAARLQEAPLELVGRDVVLERNEPEGASRLLTIRTPRARYEELLLPLRGEHQGENAALAVAAVEAFLGGEPLSPQLVAQGLLRARSPGRLQRIGRTPPVLVDAAHNPHGAAALAASIGGAVAHERLVVVLGVLDDKDAEGVVRALDPVAAEFVAVASDSPRAVDAFELAGRIAEWTGREPAAFDRVDEGLEHARLLAGGGGGAVLVTGSITVIGEAVRIMRETEGRHD